MNVARIEAQVERFAPGFRDRVLARLRELGTDVERMPLRVDEVVAVFSVGGFCTTAHTASRPSWGSIPIPWWSATASSTGGARCVCL